MAFSGFPPLDGFISKIAFANVSVSLSASPSPAQIHQPLTYTISATNAGPGAIDAVATDMLPKGMSFISGSARMRADVREESHRHRRARVTSGRATRRP